MINIMYAGNKKVFKQLLISAVSIANHASESLNIYILTMDLRSENKLYVPIDENDRVFLENILKKKNIDNKVIIIDALNAFNSFKFNDVNNMSLYTPYANLRLFADILPLPSHIIYLDTDTICNSDIKELFDLDVSNYELLAVRDVYIWGMKNKGKYFNSGMLYLNLDMIRKTHYFEKARNLCNEKKMVFLDQDALNYCGSKVKLIDRKFNTIHKKFGAKYTDNVIHHCCDVRKFGLIKFKTNNVKKFKFFFKCYRPLFEECEKYIEEYERLGQ